VYTTPVDALAGGAAVGTAVDAVTEDRAAPIPAGRCHTFSVNRHARSAGARYDRTGWWETDCE
jgi:hypothetical protein